MQIAYIDILNFRGISKGRIEFNGHSVIIGDNNAGKSTTLEAIDLVLGPDRLSRIPVIDEHDFYNGNYFIEGELPPKIEIEVLIIDLDEGQKRRFKNNLEFWNFEDKKLLTETEITLVDKLQIKESLRVKFIGSYDPEEDDFTGQTYFCSPYNNDSLTPFTKKDKRECGFLYLRALRTGARALSMERGSLLDIILRLKEIKPKMWENVLGQLKTTPVATDPSLGISNILEEVQNALKEFVPSDWGTQPLLRVSDLTREHLRKTLTVFMSTGGNSYHAPFNHQGTGTVNTMVLALLSMIAEQKMNVIFAMEEPEIAIPPYTQKRIVETIRTKSTQAIFTSHSPFVLEEFNPENILLLQRDNDGLLSCKTVTFPKTIKPKKYSQEFRMRFSEALLAKKVLITEGATEASSYFACGRRLNELNSPKYSSLSALGVAVFDAETETAIPTFGDYFTSLGKTVFAVFDKQTPEALEKIVAAVEYPFESKYNGFEDLLLNETADRVLIDFYTQLEENFSWPSHLAKPSNPSNITEIKKVLGKYLEWSKGVLGASELLATCIDEKEVPITVREVLSSIKSKLEKVTTEKRDEDE